MQVFPKIKGSRSDQTFTELPIKSEFMYVKIYWEISFAKLALKKKKKKKSEQFK